MSDRAIRLPVIGDFRANVSDWMLEGLFLATTRRMPLIPNRMAACITLVVALAACATQSRIVATNPALSLSPTCTEAVDVYSDRDHVPYDYYEVALVTARGNSVYTGNGDILKAMRSKAASVGANGLVINSLGATHATVKVIGAAVGGNDAERTGQAIAIWMPSDTARVREACGK
jgi:hypothetical protein